MKFHMKRVWWLLVLLLFLISIFVYFFVRNNDNQLKKNASSTIGSTWTFNLVNEKWEKIDSLPKINVEELDENTNEDGLHNRAILMGYFDSYDKDTNELVMKARVVWPSDQYRETRLKVSPEKTTYCAPAVTVNEKTGTTFPTQELGVMVKNDQLLTLEKEQLIDFEQFVQNSTNRTYLFIQLTQNFDVKTPNYIKKLIVVGLCD